MNKPPPYKVIFDTKSHRLDKILGKLSIFSLYCLVIVLFSKLVTINVVHTFEDGNPNCKVRIEHNFKSYEDLNVRLKGY